MRINHNIQALNAYRNLSQTMNSTSKSLEKLSSGLRINKAADDAAGLAISEKMRSQIRGLDMAERNALDAVSLIQTGEGALNEVHSILQRMRELSVQASNGTLADSDRGAIQDEINQLTYEVDRIADTTQFNQKKLFSGSEKGKSFAEVSSDQVQYTNNGTWSGVVTAEPSRPASVEIEFSSSIGYLDDSTSPSEIDGKIFEINGKKYEVNTDGTTPEITTNGNIAVNVSWVNNVSSDSDAMANIGNLMNSLKDAIEKNDSAFVNPLQVPVLPSENTTNNPTDNLFNSGSLTLVTKDNMAPKDVTDMNVNSDVNGVLFNDPDTGVSGKTTLVARSEAEDALSTSLAFSEVPKDGDQIRIDDLVFTFKSIDPSNPEATGYLNNGTATIDINGKDVYSILNEINDVLVAVKNKEADGDTHLQALNSHTVVGNTLRLSTTRTDDGSTYSNNSNGNGLEIMIKDSDFESNSDKELELGFQIGANSSESLTLSLGIMDAASLGIARSLDGTPLTTAGINASFGVDVSTEDAAKAAIDIFDRAIQTVSQERSKLGAYQNRLEHTVSNLQNANENLTSAESRIRDLDMAEEMTNFTRNNILNQAGQAMLAQANQLPQGILQLLK